MCNNDFATTTLNGILSSLLKAVSFKSPYFLLFANFFQ